MSAVAWLIIVYIVIDRIITLAMVGKSVTIDRATAFLTLITGSLIVWGVVYLAGGC